MYFMFSTKNEMFLHKHALLYQLASFIWELHVLEPCLAQWTLRQHSYQASYLHFFGSQIVTTRNCIGKEQMQFYLFLSIHFFAIVWTMKYPFTKLLISILMSVDKFKRLYINQSGSILVPFG